MLIRSEICTQPLTGLLPWLTPLAAFDLSLVMVLATALPTQRWGVGTRRISKHCGHGHAGRDSLCAGVRQVIHPPMFDGAPMRVTRTIAAVLLFAIVAALL